MGFSEEKKPGRVRAKVFLWPSLDLAPESLGPLVLLLMAFLFVYGVFIVNFFS